MKKFRVVLLISAITIFSGTAMKSHAQCSMCRQAAESNLKQGENKRGSGLNHAILYLMSVPYVMGGIGGYLLWRNRKK
ncbi:MAG: hypothetical protein ABI772_13165 [Bacteroidota bacterium]